MPELKRTFTGGRMEKDLDERIVPNGQYREALNIGVATSEDSDVGAAQNILGNTKVTFAASSATYQKEGEVFGNEHVGYNYHIAEIIDPQTDMLYRFVHTPNSEFGLWVDRIIEYDTSSNLKTNWEKKEHAVMVDVFKVQTKLKRHDCICIGSNKSKIKVSTAKAKYLRWGMLVECPPVDIGAGTLPVGILAEDGVTIEDIDYQTGWLTLSKPVFVIYSAFGGPPICVDNAASALDPMITFTGDRNLNFSTDNTITGVNIIDGMIFWTDNFSEPKKVNIRRGKIGSISQSYGGSREFDGVLGKYIGRPLQSKIDDFNQPTLLIVDDENKLDCLKDESFCPISGCTDPAALNFDPLAMYDDNSCCFTGGCTDPSDVNGLMPGDSGYIAPQFCNYDASACFDDGSCFANACGCTDPTANNYDALSVVDDGSCTYDVLGCTDPTANNYDPLATADDGSCAHNYSCTALAYTNDSCDDPSQFISATNTGNTDIFDSANWFSESLSGNRWTSVMDWFSNNSSLEYGDFNFLFKEELTPPVYATWSSGMTTNGECDYVIDQGLYPNQRLIKMKLNLMYSDMGNEQGFGIPTLVNNTDTPGYPTFTEAGTQAPLGNPSAISFAYSMYRRIIYGFTPNGDPNDGLLTSPGADIVFTNHTELVDALRSLVFDGNWNCYTDPSMLTIVPIPEVTYLMTFTQIQNIINPTLNGGTPYYFGTNVGEIDMQLVASQSACSCSGTYTGNTPSCKQDPIGQYSSLAQCQANCAIPSNPI